MKVNGAEMMENIPLEPIYPQPNYQLHPADEARQNTDEAVFISEQKKDPPANFFWQSVSQVSFCAGISLFSMGGYGFVTPDILGANATFIENSNNDSCGIDSCRIDYSHYQKVSGAFALAGLVLMATGVSIHYWIDPSQLPEVSQHRYSSRKL